MSIGWKFYPRRSIYLEGKEVQWRRGRWGMKVEGASIESLIVGQKIRCVVKKLISSRISSLHLGLHHLPGVDHEVCVDIFPVEHS